MKRSWLVVAFANAMVGILHAQDPTNKDLTDAERAQLQRDKVLLTHTAYRQVFDPYVFPQRPVFITTDSVLNAWHVLFEESVRIMEERFSNELPDALDKALTAIPKEAPKEMAANLFERGSRRAKLVLGTASKLAGGAWSGGKELDDLIAIDVRHAEEAKAVSLPEWLGKEGTGILGFDYATFRPTGFYAGKPRMERYFRAVRWLQTVPFDIKNEDQAAAMGLVIAAFQESEAVLKICETFEKLGEGDGLDAQRLTHYPSDSYPFSVSDWLSALKSAANDDEFKKAVEKPAVVLAARAMPDLDLFNRTTNERRRFPSVLEAAALFGSPLAEKLLEQDKNVIPVISEARKDLMENRSVYRDYATCLTDLLAPPEPDAPVFMKSEVWQRKSLNTCLAGWAQFRHTWALQGKENVYYWGAAISNPVGFVEPNPEFFRHLASLSNRMRMFFNNHQEPVVSSLDVSRRAADLLPMIRNSIEPCRKVKLAKETGDKLAKEDWEAYQSAMEKACKDLTFFHRVLGDAGGSLSSSGDPSGFHITGYTDAESLLKLLEKISKGEGINEVMKELEPDLKRKPEKDRWGELISICHQLETLAHKQLRGVPPAEDEVEFIQTYGEKLASVMLYDGNSWENSNDDAPRVAAVFNQPGEGFLLAGVGRAQGIRVLYPWKGKEIECFGAVMPFREMHSPKHLTDGEWKEILDGPSKPDVPDWLKPLSAAP